MKRGAFGLMVGTSIIVAGCAQSDAPIQGVDAAQQGTNVVIEDQEKQLMEARKGEFTLKGELTDVRGGNATGTAMAGYQPSGYALEATFQNLPDPQGTDFYEGWILIQGDATTVMTTGRAKKVENGYVNEFSSDADLTERTFYVLTLEPDDGDPRPAEHILEGEMLPL